jgi:ketosteroid isomerase-like protein
MTDTLAPTTTDPKIQAVERLYESFFAGDADAFVADVADAVDWAAEAASTSTPWYGPHRSKDAVRGFFAEIGSNVTVTRFDRLSYTANDTDVMVAVRWAYTVNATGRSAEMHMLHWFRFADGKIVFFRGSEDSEQSASAFAAR